VKASQYLSLLGTIYIAPHGPAWLGWTMGGLLIVMAALAMKGRQ
jgi:hypothetical protein